MAHTSAEKLRMETKMHSNAANVAERRLETKMYALFLAIFALADLAIMVRLTPSVPRKAPTPRQITTAERLQNRVRFEQALVKFQAQIYGPKPDAGVASPPHPSKEVP
jgi:hypothetical protein